MDRSASATDRPCDTRTSTCLSFATISSGLCLFCPIPCPPYGSKAYSRKDHFPGGRPIAGDGHIRFLYVDPDFTGQGIGRALVAELLCEARRRSLDTVFSDVSELARPVFLRAGFKCIARQEREIAGIRIHNHHMCFAVPERERALSQARGRSDGDT
ncbi:GNAT family N-acetyltransferase [Sulfitobacter sp. LCG007]